MIPQPNAHGVYTPTETLELPNPRKGWRGCPLAEIRLLALPDGWRSATGSSLSNGAGHGSPLMLRDTPHPTRDAAIAAAAARLRYRMEREGCTDARAVLRWLDTLRPAQPDLFERLAA